MKITVLGTGDAFDATAPNSSFHIELETQQWLFDCGPSVPQQLWQTQLADNLDVIYFSHTHSDHCAGLATLVNYWCAVGRTKSVTIICQPKDKPLLEGLIQFGTLYEEEVPFSIEWLDIQQGEFKGVGWQVARTIHGVSNYSLLLDGQLFISGDGKPSLASTALMGKARLILHECGHIYDAGSGHASLTELAEIKKQVSGEIYLYHFNESLRTSLTHAANELAVQILTSYQEIEINDECV